MRRANGTGSIVKLSGNRRRPYLVKISARDKDGYVRQVALSYHAKLQEAQEALELSLIHISRTSCVAVSRTTSTRR